VAAPFIIFSLPRSRSAWMARFLSYGGNFCGHDLAPRCGTMAEFADLLGGSFIGSTETGAVIGWRAIRRLLPDARIVVVRRPVRQVYDSLCAFGLGSPALLTELIGRDHMLERLSREPGVLSLAFDDLTHPSACSRLFEFCLGQRFDYGWWKYLSKINVQIDVPAFLQYLADNRIRIENLKRDARRIGGDGDVVIGTEAWDSLWPEIDGLFAEHFNEVEGDLAQNRPYDLNEPEMRNVNKKGFLRITTARVDGMLAGYCMWMASDDVESKGIRKADHGPWFVKPEYAHLLLGPKLFDASIADLKIIGVKCAFPHHRLNGRGAKLGAFFRRRGAIETQRTYSLWLGEPQHA
jgi:hypothetical protein